MGTAGTESSLAPEMALGSKILMGTKPCKDGETPLFIALSKIATGGPESQNSHVCSGV